MEDWLYIGFIVLVVYVLVNLIIYLIQDYFFFHPEKLHREFVFKYQFPFEEIKLNGVDDSLIDGLFFPVKGSTKVVFYFKGNTRSIKGWAKFAKDFIDNGYSFFLIDYPGFGKSTGKRDEKTIFRNSQIAYEWLKERYSEEEIVIYGRSLGAGFACHTAKENRPHLLILDSPFYSFHRISSYYTRILPIGLILKYRCPLYQYIQEVKSPVFIIHGSKDRMIPYQHSVDLEKLDPKHIKLFTIEGGRHNNLPKFEQYHRVLDRILSDEDLYKSFTRK